jgi:hypothetical protein
MWLAEKDKFGHERKQVMHPWSTHCKDEDGKHF